MFTLDFPNQLLQREHFLWDFFVPINTIVFLSEFDADEEAETGEEQDYGAENDGNQSDDKS